MTREGRPVFYNISFFEEYGLTGRYAFFLERIMNHESLSCLFEITPKNFALSSTRFL